ncbi:hypothetical protein SLA2020_422600 [Shorea laevis]
MVMLTPSPKSKPKPPPNHKPLHSPEENSESPSLNTSIGSLSSSGLCVERTVTSSSRLIPLLVSSTPSRMPIPRTPSRTRNEMKKKKKKKVSAVGGVAAEPKLSKAARRFYNVSFRDQPQRLSKVLPAAGVASR